jgi:hypothetical protein
MEIGKSGLAYRKCDKYKLKDQTRKHLDDMWVAREGRKVNVFVVVIFVIEFLLLLLLLLLLLCVANETNTKIKPENTWTTCGWREKEER